MILLIDVGNTNVTIGVHDGKEVIASWRMTTKRDLTSDEIGMTLRSYFSLGGVSTDDIDGTIISSVVPPIMYSLIHAVKKHLGQEPIIVTDKSKMNLEIKYDNPKEVGADRLVNAVGALKRYKAPLIIIDFGTATTFCAVSDKNEYLGGVILPGLKVSLEALVEKTSKLPKIEIARPDKVIGTNTVESMQSGMYYGYAGSVDNIVLKMKQSLGDDTTVIATGGLATMISKEAKTIDIIDPKLTLEGLKAIYDNETEGKE